MAGLIPIVLAEDTDLNSILSTGNYYIKTSGNISKDDRHAVTDNNCHLLVFNINHYVIQILNDQHLGIHIRSKTDMRAWSSWSVLGSI